MALTNYHIQVRYSESDNYKESPVSTADSIYFFVGEVEFKVICGEGVKYVILTSSEDDVTENGLTKEDLTHRLDRLQKLIEIKSNCFP